MSRDYEPEVGRWYEDLDSEETFQVLSIDPDEERVRIQWLDREVEDIDLDAWNELDLEPAEEPEGWVDDVETSDDEDDEDFDLDEEEEEDEDDWDEDEDDDDWDEDEDDYDDEDDEYRDRE